MSVLDRDALEASPLADLHAIAGELSLDGYRRLRKADLIDRLLSRQDGTELPADDEEASESPAGVDEAGVEASADDSPASSRRRRGRRGGRGRSAARDGADEATDEEESEVSTGSDAGGGSRVRARSGGAARGTDRAADKDGAETSETTPTGRRRSRRSESPAAVKDAPSGEATDDEEAGEQVEGVVELLSNGSGFVRVSPPDPSDDDVYISAAQVKRCELVSGDRVAGPKRPPRRSERFASLVRVDEINGRPASELADGARYDDLPAAFPDERFRFGSEDPTLKAIEFLTPIGRGSRVVISGGSRAGKTHALRLLATALGEQPDLNLFVALVGVRPEELGEWSGDAVSTPAGALSFAASADAQDHVAELVVDQARRIAARGAEAVVLIDTLDGMHPHSARKVLAAARNIRDGGSLTVIATSTRPLGGETTVIALDPLLTSAGRLPALDLVTSGTIRAELLVGEEGASAIVTARAEAAAG